VTPEVREQTQRDNALAGARRSPFGGAYGPNTCLQGYVWRDAFPGDVACVLPAARDQAAADNSQAKQRKACQDLGYAVPYTPGQSGQVEIPGPR
jgi:hypothetical protein